MIAAKSAGKLRGDQPFIPEMITNRVKFLDREEIYV